MVAPPSPERQDHERREANQYFQPSSPSFLSRITREWYFEDSSIALPSETTVGPDRSSVNSHPGVTVYRGFLLTWTKADVEDHITSTGQHPAQNQ
jgi:hypothetical protein